MGVTQLYVGSDFSERIANFESANNNTGRMWHHTLRVNWSESKLRSL